MPDLIVVLAGDSNSLQGQQFDSSIDTTLANVLQLNTTFNGTLTASEPLVNNHGGSGGSIVDVGSTLKLCQQLVADGLKPPGFTNVIIVQTSWAGTAFLNEWATTGTRTALGAITDNGVNTFYGMVNAALGLTAGNRIWFFDWNHGMNDGGQTQAQYQANMVATWGEIRANVATATFAPILVAGGPPDRSDADLGGQVNLGGVLAAQAAVESYLPNSYYVDPTGLHSYMDNLFVHFSSASHRGGTDNSNTANATRASGSWYWNAGDTYAAADHVFGSDNWCYKFVGSTGASNPTTDGGVNWKKTTYQYGLSVSNPLSARKLAQVRTFKYPLRASWA